MKKAVAAIAFAALLTGTGMAKAQDGTPYLDGGDPEAGKSLSQTCAACHGPDGNSPNAQWPNIAGQHASYTYKQLMDFKKGEERANAQMAGMVANLSEQDMRDLAAFYANQPQKTMGASNEDGGRRSISAGSRTRAWPHASHATGRAAAAIQPPSIPMSAASTHSI